MKIGILLPYKENFSPEYPGAVSLFVYETTRKSKYKKDIIVFGNTNFKKISTATLAHPDADKTNTFGETS